MSEWESYLLAALVAAALLNLGNYRAWLWLLVGATNYVLTSAYYDAGLPMHPMVTALADASTCLAIYFVCKWFGGQRWELPLFTIFQASVLVSFVQIFRGEMDYAYALLLEVCNWLALATIIAAGTTRLLDVALARDDKRGGRWRRLHAARTSAFAPATMDTWWWARRSGGSGKPSWKT